MKLFTINKCGNVLFLILVAIALFAALSYAVTQSGRSGGNVDKELALLQVSNTVQYASSVRQAVSKLRINGCSEREISFENSTVTLYSNPYAPSDNSCHVFDPAGGGISFSPPTQGINDGSNWEFSAIAQVIGQGQSTPDTLVDAHTDLAMYLRGVHQEACETANKETGLSSIPVDNGDLTPDPFRGAYDNNDILDGCTPNCTTIAASPFSVSRPSMGCFQENDTRDYVIFRVLLPR